MGDPLTRSAPYPQVDNSICKQVIGRMRYSAKVQQRPLTAASQHDRQHTELAGTTAKRPAPPLVRDEEAARILRKPSAMMVRS
jgi:hypothetical protein